MSIIGPPLDTALIQAVQAQHLASKAKDSEKAAASDRRRRIKDMVDLRVAGVESTDAIRQIPDNTSEEANDEHHRQNHETPDHSPEEERPRIDLKA